MRTAFILATLALVSGCAGSKDTRRKDVAVVSQPPPSGMRMSHNRQEQQQQDAEAITRVEGDVQRR